jgi:hypothetical protein
VIDPAQDNSRPSNWAVDFTARATPGLPNSVARALTPYDPLWLNEVQIESLTGPLDNLGDSEPWIELYNSGPTALNLDGYYLATNYTNGLTEFAFPAGTTLAPGEFKLIWADGEPGETTGADVHASFRLNSSGQLALVRLAPRASGLEPEITDYLTWPELSVNLGYGAYPDGQLLNRLTLHTPTARGTNVSPPLRVFINEWMAINNAGIRDPADATGGQDDWFELYNAEPFTVNLGGLYLSDDPGNPGKFRIPANGRYQIPSGGYLLIWADNQPDQNSAARTNLHVNFRLGGSSGDILLSASNNLVFTLIDAIHYGPQTDNVGEGRYSDGASARYSMSLLTVNSTPSGPNSVAIYNSPPRFPPIATRFVLPGQSSGTFSVRATDPDRPDGLGITYEVVSAPPGAAVNLAGLFRWIVPSNQPPGEYTMVVRATDSGVPPRSATVSFTMVVIGPGVVAPGGPPPVIGSIFNLAGQATFTIQTTVGRTYRAQYTDDLNSGAWLQLDRDFVAANPYASLTDGAAAPQRFYRVLQLD